MLTLADASVFFPWFLWSCVFLFSSYTFGPFTLLLDREMLDFIPQIIKQVYISYLEIVLALGMYIAVNKIKLLSS